ncbi:hypothetical protein DW709_09680 [Coprococcus sp. AM27-12LB]|nr:hypothetical protein DW709_09680 [Coprococcus sp. AM27-12LB]
MRCDTEVFFQSISPGEYDESTGDYKEDTVLEEKRHASVTDTGTDTMNLVYGAIKQGSKTVRLQIHYKKTFDRIRIGSTLYRVDFERKLRAKHVFVISEVQSGRN